MLPRVKVTAPLESNAKKIWSGQLIFGGMVSCTSKMPLHKEALNEFTLNPYVLPTSDFVIIAGTVQGPLW